MKLVSVNSGRSEAQFDIAKVESKYNASFVGQFCLKTKDGSWGNSPVDVYWQATPPVEGYSNYFALLHRDGTVYITSGASAVENDIAAVEADDEIIYSRYRWDCRYTKDGTAMIDGGRDYSRGNCKGRWLNLRVIDGEFYELESEDLKEIDNAETN